MKFDYKAEDLIIKPYKSESPVYVRKQKGRYQRIRQLTGFVFVMVFILLPWISYQGNQAVLFDIGKQQFHIFSETFFPQDFTLLAGLLIVSCYLLFFVTTWLGRIWCGYVCPQTVWTFSFIWVEEWLEGSRNQRIKRDKQPETLDTIARKSAKHIVWGLMAFLTATTFMSYFLPTHELYLDLIALNWTGLTTFWVLFFAICTYGNAGWLREKMCIYMCPYSRFQSAMFDKDTLTVSYDAKRGENRGPRSRKQDPKELGLGDCIDCNLCVQVCPTGIDIRNGLQYECINCGACVDACDGVMDRMKYDKGLIRYTTEHELEGKKVHFIRSKLIGYAIVLVVMTSLLIMEMANRVPVSMDIIRDRTELAKENFNGDIENVYTLKILNKSQKDNYYRISVKGIKNTKWHGEQEVFVKAASVYTLPISLSVDPYELEGYMTDISFVIELVSDTDEVKLEHESRFFNKR